MMSRIAVFGSTFAVFTLGLVLAASARAQQAPAAEAQAPAAAIAVLSPTADNKVSGTVHFTQTEKGVEVVADIQGLAPNSVHGFHIHEFGDLSDMKEGKSAGGHYNPGGHKHGGPGAQSHAGDLGNVTADAQGRATLKLVLEDVSIAGHHNPILGRSVVLHGGPDDLKTDPAGNSGPRIALGVIGVAKPQVTAG